MRVLSHDSVRRFILVLRFHGKRSANPARSRSAVRDGGNRALPCSRSIFTSPLCTSSPRTSTWFADFSTNLLSSLAWKKSRLRKRDNSQIDREISVDFSKIRQRRSRLRDVADKQGNASLENALKVREIREGRSMIKYAERRERVVISTVNANVILPFYSFRFYTRFTRNKRSFIRSSRRTDGKQSLLIAVE